MSRYVVMRYELCLDSFVFTDFIIWHGNEASGSIKGGQFPEHPRNYYLLKEHSAPCSYLKLPASVQNRSWCDPFNTMPLLSFWTTLMANYNKVKPNNSGQYVKTGVTVLPLLGSQHKHPFKCAQQTYRKTSIQKLHLQK